MCTTFFLYHRKIQCSLFCTVLYKNNKKKKRDGIFIKVVNALTENRDTKVYNEIPTNIVIIGKFRIKYIKRREIWRGKKNCRVEFYKQSRPKDLDEAIKIIGIKNS